MSDGPYHHLQSLLQSYFHQDFDLFGGDTDSIIRAASKALSALERRGIVDDIEALLACDDGKIGEFVEASADFLPSAEGLSSREWLGRIRAGLGTCG